jgi:hypothetical protein
MREISIEEIVGGLHAAREAHLRDVMETLVVRQGRIDGSQMSLLEARDDPSILP